jgi:hypothetical protein
MSRMSCKRNRTPEQKLFQVFDTLDIDAQKKVILQERYLTILENFHFRARKLEYAYYTTRVIVTVGSILVPAFLSIQGMSSDNAIYWTTWIISIAVTICNGFMTLFKLDKKYYFINTTLELLHSEGWQYVGLTGRYSAKHSDITPTHENQFTVFFKVAEKIKMRQVEEEYWKVSDTSETTNTTCRPLLTSPTPSTQQGDLASLSIEKKTLIEGWLEDMKRNIQLGLQPRGERPLGDTITGISTPRIDEGSSPSRVPGTPQDTIVSMQSRLPEYPYFEKTILSTTPAIPEEICEDTLEKILSDEPSIRK